jgi:hypothetical protein
MENFQFWIQINYVDGNSDEYYLSIKTAVVELFNKEKLGYLAVPDGSGLWEQKGMLWLLRNSQPSD